MTYSNDIFPAEKRNKWIIYFAILALSNLILYWFFGTDQVNHLDGTPASFEEVRTSTLLLLFVYLPILGFFLGSIISLFPYKGASYGQKYLRSSLLAILILEGIVFVASVLGSIFQLII